LAESDIDYPSLIQEALRTIVRAVLVKVATEGLPGDHHFYLTFRTDHPAAEVPAGLRASYPEEMTIVLQHQFWNLAVEEESFSVTLRFGGRRQHLVVPFAALTAFIDPAAKFGLQLAVPGEEEDSEATAGSGESGNGGSGELGSAGKVVSFEDFRRKDDR
jgi:hypothetical protein